MDDQTAHRGPHSPDDAPATGADAPQASRERNIADASTGPQRIIDEAPGPARLIDEDLPPADGRVDARAATLGAEEASVASIQPGMTDLGEHAATFVPGDDTTTA